MSATQSPPAGAGPERPASRGELPHFLERVRLGPLVVLVSRPDPHASDRLAIELAQTLALARRERAAVLTIRSPEAVNPMLYRVRAEGVSILGGLTGAALLLVLTAVSSKVRRLRTGRPPLRRALAAELRRRASRGALPGPVAAEVKGFRGWLLARKSDRKDPSLRRRLLREPLRCSLAPRDEQEARRELGALGIGAGERIACVHGCEPGLAVDAALSGYDAAIDLLLERGFTVVRLGDPSLSSLGRPGVVDLATSSARTPLVELACMLRAELVLCGESGPVGVAYLTDAVLVCVNATDVIGSYPVRENGFLLPKTVIDRTSRAPLGVTVLVSDRHLGQPPDPRLFSYAENTQDEIRAAVAEALRWLDGDRVETPRQRRFRELVTAAAGRLTRRAVVDDGFLGDGRVVDFCLERRW